MTSTVLAPPSTGPVGGDHRSRRTRATRAWPWALAAATAPVYRVVSEPGTLLVAQAVLFGLSAVPLARLAERRLGRAAAVAIASAYALVLPAEKAGTVVLLFGVTAFVCLRPCLSLVVVPTLLWRFASATSSYWGHEWHYNAVLMPVVFVALVDALSILRRGRAAGFASHVPSVVLTVAVLAVHVTPVGRYLHADAWTSTARSRAADAAVALVPRGSVVETETGLMSHLTAGRRTYFCGNHTRGVRPDRFVTDQSVWGQPMQGSGTLTYAQQVHPDLYFRIVFERDGITVLHRIGDR